MDNDYSIDVYSKGKSVNLFVGANFKFVNNENLNFGLTILPKLGYQYQQQYRLLEKGVNGNIEFGTRSTLILGGELKFNIQFKAYKNIWIHIRPGLSNWFAHDSNNYLMRNQNLDLCLIRGF